MFFELNIQCRYIYIVLGKLCKLVSWFSCEMVI